MDTQITLKDNSQLIISKISDALIILKLIYIKNGKTYQNKSKLEDCQDYLNSETVTIDDFITILRNNTKEIEESQNNGEINLIFTNNGKKSTITLKENEEQPPFNKPSINNIKINNENVLNIEEQIRPNYEDVLNVINLEEEIRKLKKKYDEKIKIIKKENEILIKENSELKKSIDEEKRKNDEIVRVYLENREKYEEAVKKNQNITKIYNDL